jgi:signal transduction histidine kinase
VSARVRAFIFSFQTKLVLALTAVILLAILLAGTIFVIRSRNERRQHALDRVAALAPSIYQQTLFAFILRDQSDIPVTQQLDNLANEQEVRILIVSNDGAVLYDTSHRATGAATDVPLPTLQDRQRGFVAWEPAETFPERGLTLVAASASINPRIPFRVVLAVETDTIAGAWLDVLPSLLIAALIAVPLASLAGVALARQVAYPVRKLTAASEAMVRGDYSQRVELRREDEIGRLARSFDAMAERVSLRDTQMRALLANVSHDLKTPMTSITGYAQALSDGTADDADIRAIGSVIADEAAHVNSLLADLLYLGEIDAGQVVTNREDVPLDAVLGRCLRRIEPMARAREARVVVDVDGDVLLRDVDAEKLERAFTNVLDNAAKFVAPGGEIAVEAHYANGATPPRVVCTVENSGSSIPEEELPRVFDRFFRGDRARRTASGSGLGLAIARELVELNGGTIAARNSERGVAVEITLPALPA